MASEKKMVAAAEKVTGDTITVAGRFQPNGMFGKQVIGGVIGSVVGDAVGAAVGGTAGDVIGEVGATAGYLGGTREGSVEGQVTFVVAISPTKVYVLKSGGFFGITREDLDVLHTFDRSTLSVTLKNHLGIRSMVLEDAQTLDRMEFQALDEHWSHAKDVFHELAENEASSTS